MKNNKHISLNEIGNKLPFTIPDNYFEQFALSIDQQTNVISSPIKQIIRPWMYMAAIFVGVLLLSRITLSVYNGNISRNNENYEMYITSQLDESVIYDYYLNDDNSKINIEKK